MSNDWWSTRKPKGGSQPRFLKRDSDPETQKPPSLRPPLESQTPQTVILDSDPLSPITGPEPSDSPPRSSALSWVVTFGGLFVLVVAGFLLFGDADSEPSLDETSIQPAARFSQLDSGEFADVLPADVSDVVVFGADSEVVAIYVQPVDVGAGDQEIASRVIDDLTRGGNRLEVLGVEAAPAGVRGRLITLGQLQEATVHAIVFQVEVDDGYQVVAVGFGSDPVELADLVAGVRLAT